MRFYANKRNGKLIMANMVHGMGDFILSLNHYEDILGEGNYDGQCY